MDYKEDLEKDAVDFILENEETIGESITSSKDFDKFTEDNEGYDLIHEQILDNMALTIGDAAYIIENCTNQADDPGMWEGQEPTQAIQTMAIFSYENDIYSEIESKYEELVEIYNNVSSINQDDERTILKKESDDFKKALSIFKDRYCTKPLETNQEKITALEQWLRLGGKAGLWSGFPLGSSYIDMRCGVGYSIPDVKDYNDYDKKVAYLVPEANGLYRKDVEKLIKKLKRRTK